MLRASPELAKIAVATLTAMSGAGFAVAWWLRRRSTLSIRNVYLPAGALAGACALAGALGAWAALLALAPLAVLTLSASVVGRRWRLSDLGAGEELRRHEQQRRWIWQPRPDGSHRERVYIATQGEIVRERCWPEGEPYVPMTRDDRARVPRRSGAHVAAFGGTGSGKTTSVLRAAAGRTLRDAAALLVIDQKGDPPTETTLRRLAAVAGRPFVLFDPRAPDSDHWQPLWGDRPSESVARAVAGIQTSEPYYADTLRQHVTLIACVLHAGGYWPPSFPLLVSAAQLSRYDHVLALAARLPDGHGELRRRVTEHAEWVASRDGRQALAGGLVRLDLAVGEAWRSVLEPRALPDGEPPVAVGLTQAIRAGAIVLWRTHVDAMPDEAKAITAAALADIHASAIDANAPWTVVLDEFGAVVATAAEQALALLQRGRTHQGQVYVVTQSTADIEALTGQTGLLASLSDNFTAFIAHRQTSPESRDWLAKLMGTTALWQSTDQMIGHGALHTGSGSRRRVREFRVSSDTFAELRTGEAVIHTTLGPRPLKVHVDRLALPSDRRTPRITAQARSACEIQVHPASQLPPAARRPPTTAQTAASDAQQPAATAKATAKSASRARQGAPRGARQQQPPSAGPPGGQIKLWDGLPAGTNHAQQ